MPSLPRVIALPFLLLTATLRAANADLSGLWLTNLGLMELQQTDNKVQGHYALKGVSDIQGTLKNSRLTFTYSSFTNGRGAFEFDETLKTFTGSAHVLHDTRKSDWTGRRADEFVRHVKLQPGKILDGSTTNLLTYTIRAPESYKPDDITPIPGYAGTDVYDIGFSVNNSSTLPVEARLRIYFYDGNESTGKPGTFIRSFGSQAAALPPSLRMNRSSVWKARPIASGKSRRQRPHTA